MGCINLLMISLIWDRSLPVYWELLRRKQWFWGTNCSHQQSVTATQEYKTVVLGTRFCSNLVTGLHRSKSTSVCVSNKMNLCKAKWLQLKALGLIPGTACVLKWSECDQATGIYARSMWHVSGNKYWGWAGMVWFFSNLSDLESAILAYKKRFGIEEMCARL